MATVTVIMPSLNVAEFIRECMDSVLNQTLSDIEVLAVDAGSDDGTLEILREYEQNDPRVSLILSEMKSYGHQINLGLERAKGKYIAIVETDDCIAPDMFANLVERAEKYDLDFAKGYTREIYDLSNGSRYFRDTDRYGSAGHFEEMLYPQETPALMIREMHLWTGIYRAKLFDDIRLNESRGAAFQDAGFIVQTMAKAKKAMYVDVPGYLYRCTREGSSIYNANGLKYLIGEYRFIKSLALREEIGAYIDMRLFRQLLWRVRTMAVGNVVWDDAENDLEILRREMLNARQNGMNPHDILTLEECALFVIFCKAPMDVYAYYKELYQSRYAQVADLCHAIGKQKVVICGCGKMGRYTHALLDRYGMDRIVAFADAGKEQQGTKVQGLKVLSPEEAARAYPDACFVIANKYSYKEIGEKLAGLGIDRAQQLHMQVVMDKMLLAGIRKDYIPYYSD